MNKSASTLLLLLLLLYQIDGILIFQLPPSKINNIITRTINKRQMNFARSMPYKLFASDVHLKIHAIRHMLVFMVPATDALCTTNSYNICYAIDMHVIRYRHTIYSDIQYAKFSLIQSSLLR